MSVMTDLSPRQTVLVVDDTPDNLILMSGLLKDMYKVKVANSGEKALRIARGENPPDLILLDIMMPAMDGYEVCRQLKATMSTRNIPIIFLTAKSAGEDEEKGLQLGAVDYITKPISPPILLARVRTHLQIKASADFLRDKAAYLEQEVMRRTRESVAVQDVTVMSMASMAETRDEKSFDHIRRTQLYVHTLAEKLQRHERFAGYFTDAQIAILFHSTPLHDIGKFGVPDQILLKPGRLDAWEFEVMMKHTTIGRDALENAERKMGVSAEYLACAKEIAFGHHERWGGSGYPQGISGESIPISARLMALADVYDALISKRVYKQAIAHADAVEVIADGRGSFFDPDIVEAFLDCAGEFEAIARRYAAF